MNNLHLTPTVLALAVLLGACGTSPKSTSLLDQTHSDFRIAQNNPNVVTYAALELKQASEAMAKTDALAAERAGDAQIDQHAYLTRQKIALAEEVAKQKMAEAKVQSAGKQRDQIRLDQRTNEANAANIRADTAKQATVQAQDDALRAHQQTQMAQVDVAVAQLDAANAGRIAREAQARNAELEAQLAELSVKKTDRGMVITLGDVLFGIDLSRLTSDGTASVQKLARVLELNPQRTVLIEGFTDSTGTPDYNQQLSERRATAVQSALLQLGVAHNRVLVHGYGESYPVADNDTAPGRQANRRVEIILSDDTGRVLAR
jgi:outer membrane protein OmpA-like peptidoglycan-associated protein